VVSENWSLKIGERDHFRLTITLAIKDPDKRISAKIISKLNGPETMCSLIRAKNQGIMSCILTIKY
jgi:hypothetical protein